MASNTAVFTLLIPLIGPSPLIHGQVHHHAQLLQLPTMSLLVPDSISKALLQSLVIFCGLNSHDINRLTR